MREAQFGQSVPAVKVVATVTLENGKVLVVENTALAGTPSEVYPEAPTEPEVPKEPKAPKNQDACKDGGWKTFTDPSYKNQGQCVKAHVK